MGSKGRIPPHHHLRRPHPGHGLVRPDPFGPGVHPSMPGPFPHFDMVPPPEVMEQKIAAQHVEMQRLAAENHRLANTHGTLRQELAAAQHELQMLHAHIDALKAEREQQIRGLMEKIARLEGDLKDADSVRLELQQARSEAEKLVGARQELLAKVHQLNQDLHRAHTDSQHIQVMMSELENLRQEYQRCRVSYDYEKKLFNDHLESLQVMEKNYLTMSKEVEKLRSELTRAANVDMRTVAAGPYGGTSTNNERQNMYEDGYGIPQGQVNTALPGNTSASAANASSSANPGTGTSNTAYIGAQSGAAPSQPGYDVARGLSYGAPKGPGLDVSRGPGFDPQRGYIYDHQRGPGYETHGGPGYEAHRTPGYDVQRGHGYDAQWLPGYDMQRGANYDPARGSGYDAAARGVTGLHGQAAHASNMPYGSATPPPRSGNGYEAQPQVGNPVKR